MTSLKKADAVAVSPGRRLCCALRGFSPPRYLAVSACCFCRCVASLASFRAPGSWLNPKKRGRQEARRLHHQNKIRRVSRQMAFLTERKGRSVRLSPTPKSGRVIWVVEGAGGADQPKIWPYSHPPLRHPKAPLFATSAKRSPNALPARGQAERQWGHGPSHHPEGQAQRASAGHARY